MTRFVLLCTGTAILGLLGGGLGGCSSARVAGKVIEGDVSFIALVDQDDQRLQGPGISGATIKVRSDPGKLRGETLVDSLSGPDGQIKFSLGGEAALGAQVGYTVRKPGYMTARGAMSTPGAEQRLLVIMKRGADTGGDDTHEMLDKYR